MITKGLYVLTSLGLLAMLAFEAPMGILLTSVPEKGKVGKQAPAKNTTHTRRHPGVGYWVFMGGGYHGGK